MERVDHEAGFDRLGSILGAAILEERADIAGPKKEGKIGAMGHNTTRVSAIRGGATGISYRVIRPGASGVNNALNVNSRRWGKLRTKNYMSKKENLTVLYRRTSRHLE